MTAVTANALHLIGLALKGSRLEIGEEPVDAACRAKRAKVVLLASDAAENTARRAERFGQTGKVPCVTLPFTKVELGRATGRASCAMLALTDVGLAASLLGKLAALYPERYGETARTLDEEAQRSLQRQKERRAQERSAQRRKAKPWAAPGRESPPRKDHGSPKKL